MFERGSEVLVVGSERARIGVGWCIDAIFKVQVPIQRVRICWWISTFRASITDLKGFGAFGAFGAFGKGQGGGKENNRE
jgi:hypothetical protein